MAVWLLMIMVPVSLAVKILAWSGLLAWIAQPLNPVFACVGLPGETVVAFLTGVFLNIYSAIAALGSISLTDRHVTIFAVMALISHNFPVEAAVQHKTGTPAWRTIGLRLASSLVAGLVLNWLLPVSDVPAKLQAVASSATGLAAVLRNWAIDTAWLAGKVIGIVMGLMVLQRVLKEFGIIRVLSQLLFPVLWLLGLPRRTAFLWIVANVLGLAYGAAVILEEAESGALGKEDAQLLNRSIAVCHSLLEDTLLFVAIGAWALWITLPRVALAAAVVWIYRAGRLLSQQATVR
jgi:spore maturation protein SpmB